jgi:hypothetical protein
VFEARNHQANPAVASIVGMTIASMMKTASSRIIRSPAATGPAGARMESARQDCGAANSANKTSVAWRRRLVIPRHDAMAGIPPAQNSLVGYHGKGTSRPCDESRGAGEAMRVGRGPTHVGVPPLHLCAFDALLRIAGSTRVRGDGRDFRNAGSFCTMCGSGNITSVQTCINFSQDVPSSTAQHSRDEIPPI